METEAQNQDPARVATLEAFADTIVPGEKRSPDDRAVAGVAAGGGAVASGALQLLEEPAGGISEALDALVLGLNDHATEYAEAHGVALDDGVPAFVSLPYEHRAALVQQLTTPGHPEKQVWVGLALFSNMAFDSASHLGTAEAFAAGHPGLLTIGFQPPGEDGLNRFPDYSYGRPLADLHPDTTATGSPA
ncbi:DUF5987 family protein [Dactylosporangium siamense]|uniref:Uncharacterized protein n=1 Tax=Dactylosporangium siamense TaxID=685454 RepID=A0A919UE01_9ACTN|nr:DUF5987 family protein [Dactylosporangium siamense]GIG47158.1 hypothetical protein Dsi01nite_051990 [Dactylosporangium siamense]